MLRAPGVTSRNGAAPDLVLEELPVKTPGYHTKWRGPLEVNLEVRNKLAEDRMVARQVCEPHAQRWLFVARFEAGAEDRLTGN
jgi:hypothetical protein